MSPGATFASHNRTIVKSFLASVLAVSLMPIAVFPALIATNQQLQTIRPNEGFRQSNVKHSIDSQMFGNFPGLNDTAGGTARWHVVSNLSNVYISS